MPPRRVQLKSSLATVIAEAKKNFDAQKQYFQQEASEIVEKWHQNSLRNFDALQMRISELLLNGDCSDTQDIVKEKPVKDPSMPSLEPPSEQPSEVDLIKSLQDFVEEEVSIQIENFEDPMLGFANLPVFMTPSTAPTTEPFMNTTFDFPNNPVTFSEYELNDIGELKLLTVNSDIEIRNSGEQMNLATDDSHKALEESNYSVPKVKRVNAKKGTKDEKDVIPTKRRKKDENIVPNAIKDLKEGPKTGFKHKIIVDKETLARMREQKKTVKKRDSTKSKESATDVVLSLF